MIAVSARMSEVCTHCQVFEAGPYCLVHGVVHRAFSIGGRYEVEALLAASAASFVFGAVDQSSRRSVAVKVLRSQKMDSPWSSLGPANRPTLPERDMQQQFQRAAITLAHLPQDHAAAVLDVGRDDELGVTYVVIDREGREAELENTAWSVDMAMDAALDAALETQVTAAMSIVDPDLSEGSELHVPEMIGSYRVVRELGAGSTGRVYLGEHPVIGSLVAIKVLLPEIARQGETVVRFLQEARASGQIGSPHIPRYFDFGTSAGLPYAVMEYFEGETLARRLARTGTLSIEDTAQIIDQVASALQMAHDAGLIHRDLKPDNLLLVETTPAPGRLAPTQTSPHGAEPGKRGIDVKVLDFGIAKMVGRGRSATQTQSGAFLGTPFYCAPEQVFGHNVDERTDVYSLGATAFEMLTGGPPFVGEVPEILSSKATEEAPDPRAAGVPDVVAATIRKMLARDPRDRAPSMAWVREQVARWTQPGVLGASSTITEVTLLDAPPDLGRLERADTAIPDDEDRGEHDADDTDGDAAGSSAEHDAAVANATMPELPPRPRRKWALRLTGGAVVAAAAAAALLVVPPLRARTSPPAHASNAQIPATEVAAHPAVPSPPAPPAQSPPAPPVQPPAGDQPATDGSAAAPPAPAEHLAATPPAPPAPPTRVHSRTPAPHAGHVGEPSELPVARPPHPRPPPGKRPTPKQDVLIVDPFSQGN